jgi:hypothetical protein
MVAKLEAGITRPSLELAAKIQHLTSTWDEGAIQALEWLPVTPEATKAAS